MREISSYSPDDLAAYRAEFGEVSGSFTRTVQNQPARSGRFAPPGGKRTKSALRGDLEAVRTAVTRPLP